MAFPSGFAHTSRRRTRTAGSGEAGRAGGGEGLAAREEAELRGPAAHTVPVPVANADHYDPDYEFLQQDLSNADQIPQHAACHLSPLPEASGEAGPPFLGHPFQVPLGGCPQPDGPSAPGWPTDTPPALPEKKRRSAASQTADGAGCRASYERHPSQYDNIAEDDLQTPGPGPHGPFTPFAAVLPFQQGGSSASVEFVADFTAPEPAGDPEKPPPLPEKKNKHSKCVCSCCWEAGFVAWNTGVWG